MKANYIYSGVCRVGKIGTNSNLVDNNGVNLQVGDIVTCNTVWVAPGKSFHGDIRDSIDLVVTSDQYRNVSGLDNKVNHIKNTGDIRFIVRGIANVNWLDLTQDWRVYLKTRCTDIPVGSQMTTHRITYKKD